jgi:2-methylisocitrate lyase-like PEP mutase family enzyme
MGLVLPSDGEEHEMPFRELIETQNIIIAPGAYDVVSAQIIERAGFPVAYITGLGNEASDLGCPDVGLTTAAEFVRRAGNVVQAVSIPVVCDADTGFGGALNIYRTIRMFEAAGVSGVHLEDQTFPKRCGVLTGKEVIAAEAFAKKVRAAVDARQSDDFVIIARTDAKASLGIDEVITRLNMYVDSGADMAMLGDFYTFDEYQRIVKEVKAPIVACASDHAHFSLQPDFSIDEWKRAGVKMVVYWHLPLFAAMKAVTDVVQMLKETGTTRQMREKVFTYEKYEEIVKLSQWLSIDEKYR